MLPFALALLSAPLPCVAIEQQCRACPTDGKQGCSSVGIACQPSRKVCERRIPPDKTERRANDKRLR